MLSLHDLNMGKEESRHLFLRLGNLMSVPMILIFIFYSGLTLVIRHIKYWCNRSKHIYRTWLHLNSLKKISHSEHALKCFLAEMEANNNFVLNTYSISFLSRSQIFVCSS